MHVISAQLLRLLFSNPSKNKSPNFLDLKNKGTRAKRNLKNRSDEDRGPAWPDAKAHYKATISEVVVLVLKREIVAVTWPPETEGSACTWNRICSESRNILKRKDYSNVIGVVGKR